MNDQPIGTVLAIALRTAVRGPMKEVAAATAVEGGGLTGDVPEKKAHRGVTLLAAGHWRDVTRELGVELPWHTRRANVLIEADRLGHLVGKTVRIGDVQIKITGETKPCSLMDQLHNGLRDALAPDCRAGVHGQVLHGGDIRVGDQAALEG